MTPLDQAIAAVRAALPSDAMPVADPLALAVERLLVEMEAERPPLPTPPRAPELIMRQNRACVPIRQAVD